MEYRRAQSIEHVRKLSAQERVVCDIGMGGQQDGDRCPLFSGRFAPCMIQQKELAVLCRRLCALGVFLGTRSRLPCAPRLMRRGAKFGREPDERFPHANAFKFVHKARNQPEPALGERVGNQVGQGLELRAEHLEPSQVADARNEYGVARANKGLHMPKKNLRGQTAFVMRQGVALRNDVLGGGGAQHHLAPERLEERRPERSVAIVQQSARHTDALDVGESRSVE